MKNICKLPIIKWFIGFIACMIIVYVAGGNNYISNQGFFEIGDFKDGRVIKVTNLESKGEGSFRDAVNESGARYIVFEVSGVIDLKKENIVIENPYLFIAGETAPGDGITLIRGGISIRTHDVVVRHLKVRPGDAGENRKSGWEVDGIAASGAEAYNIKIDHCSVTWSTDENISVSGPRLLGPEHTARDVVISNCIIAEGLSNSTHAKGEHSKGSLIHDNCQNVLIKGNLYAHNKRRNPYFKTGASGTIMNNLIYNPGTKVIHTYWVQSEWEGHPEPNPAKISIIGNVLIPGKDTKAESMIDANHAELFIEDNSIEENTKNIKIVTGEFKDVSNYGTSIAGNTISTASEIVESVLKNVGARPWKRDNIDLRILENVENRVGRIINSQDDVEGYPQYESEYRKLDVPEENIEKWLNTFIE